VIDQSIEDLDLAALERMLGTPMDLNALRTLDLVVQDQGRWVPTNGAILLAGLNRHRFFPFAWVQCARFRGDEKLDIFDRVELRDHLPLLVDQTMDFLKKHSYLMAEFGDVRRKDAPSIPVAAIREVVVNAVAHASYSAKGSPIRVAFYDSRIEVESPGTLMPGVTIEDMIAGVSSIRNPTLARVFFEMGFMEEWGTGLRGVFRAVAQQGLPEPEITELPGRIRVTVFVHDHKPLITPRPGTVRGAESDPGGESPSTGANGTKLEHQVHGSVTKLGSQTETDVTKLAELGAQADRSVTKLAETGAQAEPSQDGSALRARTGDGPGAAMSPTAATGVPRGKYSLRILELGVGDGISRQGLLAALHLANSYRSFSRHVLPLVEAGFLERTRPDLPTSPLQRYRTSEIGLRVLAAQGLTPTDPKVITLSSESTAINPE
jgi:hypothetical protein